MLTFSGNLRKTGSGLVGFDGVPVRENLPRFSSRYRLTDKNPYNSIRWLWEAIKAGSQCRMKLTVSI
jgi:hypothetical protein